MSTSASIQAAINRGYAIAGAKLGQTFALYRPATPWVAPGTLITTLSAQFTNAKASDFSFTKSAGYEDFLWHGLLDGSATQVGDILAGADTYFIAAQKPLLPIVCALADRTVQLRRPRMQTNSAPSSLNVGVITDYSGETSSTLAGDPSGEDILITGCPAAIQFVSPIGRTAQGGTLPTDVRPGAYTIMLPISVFARGAVRNRDILVDDLGQRYIVEDAYFSPLGYKLRTRLLEI